MDFRVTINPDKLTDQVRTGAREGVTHAVEHLLTESNKSVPHDDGTLERSGDTGVTDTTSGVSGSVSYDTPYAVRQHEDLSLNHDGKGRAKWLELTMAAERPTLGQIVATQIRKRLRR